MRRACRKQQYRLAGAGGAVVGRQAAAAEAAGRRDDLDGLHERGRDGYVRQELFRTGMVRQGTHPTKLPAVAERRQRAWLGQYPEA